MKEQDRFWAKVDKTHGCWNWTASTREGGYGRFGIGAHGGILAHRYSYILHNGEIPDGLCVLHHCDNPSCVRPDHLFLGTKADNARDKVSKGRQSHPRGELNPKSKLSEAAVRVIKKLLGRIPQLELAQSFNVSQQTINNIAKGRRWSHLI